MNKFQLIGFLKRHGDVIVTTKDEDDGDLVTVDFSPKHIRAKGKPHQISNLKALKNNILVFSWTKDKFIELNPKTVVSTVPLQNVLRNVR